MAAVSAKWAMRKACLYVINAHVIDVSDYFVVVPSLVVSLTRPYT